MICNIFSQALRSHLRAADETFPLPSGQGKNILSILLILSKNLFMYA
jgi:hypothetical protein